MIGPATNESLPSATAAVSSSKAAVISARNVNFSFGEGDLQKQVLFDVSLDVMPGEIVLLTGPSGSGKTTLLTLIGALRKIRDGELHVLGRELHHASQDELVAVRREIGFIFQQHNLLPFMTARQNVQLMFSLHPEVSEADATRLTVELLSAVGLAHRVDYYPDRLSGARSNASPSLAPLRQVPA